MKIAFFGTPEFAGNILSGILAYPELEISLVVSQPDKAIGRKRDIQTTAVKSVALTHNIRVIQPERIKKNADFFDILNSLELDFIVVVAYGKIIPKEILDIPRFGCINIHGSILPKYRGASPVQAAIKNGDSQTGLTIMYMSQGMDEGDILQIQKVSIDNIDTSEDIFEKFVSIGPKLLVDTLHKVIKGEITGVPQNHSESSHCSKISREDGRISFGKQTSNEIFNTFRAYTSWPGIHTFYNEKRLVLEDISLFDNTTENEIEGEIGECIKISKNRYGILCCDGKILEVLRVKLEGKKSMDALSFVNGNKEVLGYKFV
ncbi:methionyl-tRNA formyltransferase [Candidatus Gracilibacteria bacterium]|nr:methionyl-tRNA formyltransferase [Candidatus Gracilibacteria bacterium]